MSDPVVVVPIVEGHGEVEAVPILLRRIAAEWRPVRSLDVRRPIRVSRDRMVKSREIKRYVELASRMGGERAVILVLADADDDCPKDLAPSLLDRARDERPDRLVSVVLAQREFEAWFLGAAESLRGQRGLPDDLETPASPEGVRDAKGWLQARRTDGFAYSPTSDQPALVSVMDLHLVRRACPSFDKLWRDLDRLTAEASAP